MEVLSSFKIKMFFEKISNKVVINLGQCGPDEKRDTGINLLPYFERSCFQGFGDDENVRI